MSPLLARRVTPGEEIAAKRTRADYWRAPRLRLPFTLLSFGTPLPLEGTPNALGAHKAPANNKE